MKRFYVCFLVLSALSVVLLPTGTLMAAQLYSWETGLEGWSTSGFGNGSEFVNTSGIASTDGVQSLQLGHDAGDFSWDASIVLGPDDADLTAYNTISNSYANPTGRTLEFDVIWRDTLLNSTPFSFANISFSLQDDNLFRNVHGLAEILAPADSTVHVSLPLDSGELAGGIANSSFYRLTIALNTDFSFSTTSSVLIDNLLVTPEPGSLLLLATAGSMLGLIRRRRQV